MSENVQQVEQQETVKGQTVISLTKPTPVWATWVFRIVFILVGVASFVVLGDTGISDSTKVRIALYLTAADRAVWAITRVIGVDVSRDFNVPKDNV